MRSSYLVALAVGFLSVGCSAADKADGTTDSGRTDSSAKDTGSTLSETGDKDTGVPDDTSVRDTGTLPDTDDSGIDIDSSPPPDTGPVADTREAGPTDTGPVGGCDKHTGDLCDLVKQDCVGTKSCVYDSTAKHNVCANVTLGTAGKGEKCRISGGDCDRGLECLDGVCTPACCSGDDSVCGTGGKCNVILTDSSGVGLYNVCSYAAPCNPFKYNCPVDQVCLFSEEPASFACSKPSPGSSIGSVPGNPCKYRNDCGESQICLGDGKCHVLCWLDKIGTPGTTPGGRFPANGTCTIGGKSYGTCGGVTGLGKDRDGFIYGACVSTTP